jgi:hypothetical protein
LSDNIWVSFRHPDGRTFTIGGSDPGTFEANAVGMGLNADKLIEDFQVLGDPPVAQAVANAAPIRQGGATAPAAPGAPMCDHGMPRVFKDAFTSKAGKAMPSSWQCQSRDRNDQCKAKWNDA